MLRRIRLMCLDVVSREPEIQEGGHKGQISSFVRLRYDFNLFGLVVGRIPGLKVYVKTQQIVRDLKTYLE